MSWNSLLGILDRGPEAYQPWMQYLPDGRIACAGHYGADDPMGKRDQYISLHLFRVEISGKSVETELHLGRVFDKAAQQWRNEFTLQLTANGTPLPDKELEVWYVERDQPGYDAYSSLDLPERMKLGGRTVRLRTGGSGVALLSLPQFDRSSWEHHTIQVAARFAGDRDYRAAQTCLFEFYTRVK